MRQIDWTTFPQMSYNKTVCKDEVMGGWMPEGEEDMDIFALLRLVLGLAFFLFGMNVMSSNLEKMAGGKLEQLLKTMTASPWVSLLLGAAITIAVQSSSAVTVMLVGLVNSGIMKIWPDAVCHLRREYRHHADGVDPLPFRHSKRECVAEDAEARKFLAHFSHHRRSDDDGV